MRGWRNRKTRLSQEQVGKTRGGSNPLPRTPRLRTTWKAMSRHIFDPVPGSAGTRPDKNWRCVVCGEWFKPKEQIVSVIRQLKTAPEVVTGMAHRKCVPTCRRLKMETREAKKVKVTPEEAARITEAKCLVALLSAAGEVSVRTMPASEIPAFIGHTGLTPVSVHPVEPVFPPEVLDLVVP